MGTKNLGALNFLNCLLNFLGQVAYAFLLDEQIVCTDSVIHTYTKAINETTIITQKLRQITHH